MTDHPCRLYVTRIDSGTIDARDGARLQAFPDKRRYLHNRTPLRFFHRLTVSRELSVFTRVFRTKQNSK